VIENHIYLKKMKKMNINFKKQAKYLMLIKNLNKKSSNSNSVINKM